MHQGTLTLTDQETTMRDMVRGDLVIDGASEVEVTGMVKGSVRLKGGSARVRGMVGGDVINEGGSLTVRGMVTGSVRTLGGTTVVERGAMVGGTVST